MSGADDSSRSVRFGRWLRSAAECGVEALLAGAALYATDALAHRKLTAAGFGWLWAGWLAALVLARVLPSRTGCWARVVEFALPAVWAGVCSPFLKQPWTVPQVIHAAALVGSLWFGWRWCSARAGEGARVAESLRLFLVGGVACGVMVPWFTDLQIGGRDAAWYSSVFIDFIQQLRAGVFPVFLGQGELSYNGSANLFRSAPLCLWIGGIWDWLTWQSLSPVALRNLSAITAALGAGFGMYAVLNRLLTDGTVAGEGARRWLAALGACFYVCCPACLHALYFFELQMTFTALLALPWIFYGNLRVMQGTGHDGYVPLAVGLSLAWLAHAPLAIISMCSTIALQFGRYAFEPDALSRQWKAALTGGLLFALLSAYYFAGMTELAGVGGKTLPREAAWLLAMILVILSGVWSFHFRRWRWLAGWALGTALVGWLAPVWLPWVLIWSALWAGGMAGLRRAGVRLADGRAALIAAATMLAAAALAQVWVGGKGFPPDELMLRELSYVIAARDALLRPIVADLSRYGNSQPGYALIMLALTAAVLAWRTRSLVLALPVAIISLILAMTLGLPLASQYIVGHAPAQIGNMINLPMLYRLLPPMAALAVMAGCLGLAGVVARSRFARAVLFMALMPALLWSGREAWRLAGHGFKNASTRASTEEMFSPDRYALGRYPYNMLFSPLHFMDGKQLPFMDARLLTRNYDLIVGPDYLARQAEEAGRETFPLTSTADKDYKEWLRLTPGWEVHPGQTLFLRFEFDPRFNCSGWLTMSSDRCYQEHYLSPVYEGAGFGAGPFAARTIAITNSGRRIERYTMQLKADANNTLPRDGGVWGRLHVSRYDAATAPVRLDSLVPLRARVVMPENGYFESPRQWIAGYRGTVDGRPVEPEQLKSGMLGLPLTAGVHQVELRFVGSARLWAGLVLSAGAWLGLMLWPWVRHADWKSSLKEVFARWREANRT